LKKKTIKRANDVKSQFIAICTDSYRVGHLINAESPILPTNVTVILRSWATVAITVSGDFKKIQKLKYWADY
jgi:hypothetical protein